METRVEMLEQIAKGTEKLLAKMDMRLDRIENQFVHLEKRFDQIDQRLDRMDIRMDRLEDRQISDFKWLLGLGIGSTVTLFTAMLGLLGTMAHGFHWI